jgi:hypothetical protein
MTRANEIIVDLLKSKDFNDCMRKAVKPELHEDLTAELSLILLETDPERIIQLHQNKKLTFYTVKIILTLAYSKTSSFYKKYRLVYTEFIDRGYIDDHSIIDIKERQERALSEIERLEWYESEMVKLYLECGTYRNMNKATRIPVMSCFKAINGAVKKIQKAI